MSVDHVTECLYSLNITLRCCRMPLVSSNGKFVCHDCKSVWKNDCGNWQQNMLLCCGNEIKPYDQTINPYVAFYCVTCNQPRQVCSGGCMEMLHIKHHFYHHLCHQCFHSQLEADEILKREKSVKKS